MYRYVLIFCVLLLLASCSQTQNNDLTATALLSKTMEAHGAAAFYDSQIEFYHEISKYTVNYSREGRTNNSIERRVNNIDYKATYTNGLMQYYINDSLQPSTSYNNKILNTRLDAFLYTFSIPHVLNTNDVNASLLADATINKSTYYSLDIKFKEIEGVYDDHFILYIDPQTYLIKYMAIDHLITGEVIQFRRYINFRTIQDIVFSDYYIFTPSDNSAELHNLFERFNRRDITEKGKVVLDSIRITPAN